MTETTEPSGTSDTDLWRQAIEICESLSGLSRNQVITKLKAMELAPALLKKIQRIMENMSASNPLLDQHDYQTLIDSLKQGNHLIGKTIDGYLIKKLVAKGGMSAVYEAEFMQAKHQKPVAIKLLSPYGITEKAIELFNREQLILSKLSHPSIVAFHHSGLTVDGTHYLVMEYLSGAENVVDYCKQHHYSKQQVVQLVKKLCLVFAYAHDKQVIHRDIKAGNILVDEHGEVKVIDFGIGRLDLLDGQTMTQVFTPDAAAPEQLLGQEVSNKTDVYSLGALLLQLLTLEKPLAKASLKNYDPQNDVKHLKKVFKNSDLDKDLKNILATAMHIDPALRYATMNAFAEDLNNWLNHKSVNATADSIMYRLSRFYQRNKAISIIASMVVVVLLLALLIIHNLDFQKQQATSQRNSTFALLEAMIDQADPTTNDHVVDGDAMVKTLNELATRQADLLASDQELSQFFYHKLGRLYNSKGLYPQALENYQKAFASLKQYTDENDEEYITRELTIAHLLESNGEFELAQKNGEAVLKKIEGLADLSPELRLDAYYLLAKVHQYQAENEVSKEFGFKAIEWIKSYPGINKSLQGSIYNSLAVTNRNLGDVATAELQYEKAIELLRPIREKHLDLSSILVNFAILKGRSGDMAASEALFNEAFELVKSIDVNHSLLAIHYLPYSTLLQFTDRLDESKKTVHQAIQILEANNNKKYLASAYMKYARIGLYQYEVDVALEYIGKAFVHQKDITGLDHPIIYDLYNMALWVMMVDEYQAYGKKLIENIDLQVSETTKESKEYMRFQMQKSFLLQQTPVYDLPESAFIQFDIETRKFPQDRQKHWLQQQLETHGNYSDIVTAYLNLQMALIDNNFETVMTICSPEQDWSSSSQLAHKMIIIDNCLAKSEQLETKVVNELSQLHKQVTHNTPHRIALFEELLSIMQ